jgi:protein-tyrosine phosphatase
VTFSVLFLCTGNICRSPMAELLARRALDAALGQEAARFVVSSAGTWGHDGSPMEAEAVEVLDRLGIDGRSFRARELTTAMLAGADLVLGVAREHSLAAASLDPSASSRVFPLSEFARIVTGLPPVDLAPVDVGSGDLAARARGLVAAAAAAREARPLSAPVDGDVADPYGAPLHVFAQSAQRIQDLLEPLVGRLTGAAQPAPTRSPSAGVGMARP